MENNKHWDLEYSAAWDQGIKRLVHADRLNNLGFRFLGTSKIAPNKPNITGFRSLDREWKRTYDGWQLEICGFLRLRCFIGTYHSKATYSIWRVSWDFTRLATVLEQFEDAWKSREMLSRRRRRIGELMDQATATLNLYNQDFTRLSELRRDPFNQGWVYFPGLRRVTSDRNYARWKLMMRLLTILSVMPYGVGLLPTRIKPRRIPKPDMNKRNNIVHLAQAYLRAGSDVVVNGLDTTEALKKHSVGPAYLLRQETLSRLTSEMGRIKKLDAYQAAYKEITGNECSPHTAKSYMTKVPKEG